MRIDRGRYSILFYHHSVNFPSCRSTNHYLCILRMVCMEHKFHRKRQLCALHRRGSSQDILCNEHEAHNTKRSIAAAFFPHLHGARTHCAPNDTHNYLFLFFCHRCSVHLISFYRRTESNHYFLAHSSFARLFTHSASMQT